MHAFLPALPLFLAGCVLAAPAPEVAYVSEPVMVAPPRPRFEYTGPPPAVGYVWINGYWHWNDSRHVWVPGRWEAPQPGQVWVPHRWERDGSQWRQHGGYWQAQPHPPARGRQRLGDHP